ncbi:transmembrane protein 267 [Centruroides vittatus]|uniref:transmembrane protein 267 n=1 Tax=Centruroides vittatus TaxID=120091 RepID=UPI0035100A2D
MSPVSEGALLFAFKYFILSNILLAIGIYVDRWAAKTIKGDNLAFVDTLVHFALGSVSWCMVICKESFARNYRLYKELFLCGCLSSFIDVDHFLMAKSFRLRDALSLRRRPPLHCTSLLLSAILALVVLGNVLGKESARMGLLSLTAAYTHHFRDGLRRGLWFWPFGSTPPITNLYYVICSLTFPLLFNLILYSSEWKSWCGFGDRSVKSISIV